MSKDKCFIIAPISTSPERAALHLNDDAHCEHVIEHLLVPAVVKAGFEPIKPKAKGANLIHAEIVQNLQTAALVLCDMSGLNPNVFFELGIRTAMNMPICLTIDEATKDPPFDLDLVNHHSYVSDLRPWVLPGEVDKLAGHIKESAMNKENALWKYFSLRVKADVTDRPGPVDKLDLLVTELDALRKQISESNILARRERPQFKAFTLDPGRQTQYQLPATTRLLLVELAKAMGIHVKHSTMEHDRNMTFSLERDVPLAPAEKLINIAEELGVNLILEMPQEASDIDPKKSP